MRFALILIDCGLRSEGPVLNSHVRPWVVPIKTIERRRSGIEVDLAGLDSFWVTIARPDVGATAFRRRQVGDLPLIGVAEPTWSIDLQV